MTEIESLLARLQSGSELGVPRAVQEFILGPIKGSQKAVPTLIAIFENSQDGNLRQDCALALGRIGGEQARTFLRGKMSVQDPQVMYGVASGLFSAGDKSFAVRMYYAMMESEDPEIRTAGRRFVQHYGRPVPEDMLLPDGGSVASLI